MSQFFTIAINAKEAPPSNATIEQVLDTAVTDWLRFCAGSYVVAYSGDPTALYNQLSSVLKPGDNVMILEANLNNRGGWASTVVVEWLKKHSP